MLEFYTVKLKGFSILRIQALLYIKGVREVTI